MTIDGELDTILSRAASASDALAATAPATRAGYLRAVAAALDAERERLVAIARDETHLTDARLQAELTRTAFQWELYAREIEGGHHFHAVVDHADGAWPMGPRPDIRRTVVPLGPVLVYGASNFPFAFGVAGGDTSSALAAGCSVVVKGHSYHPRLAAALGEVVADALSQAGAPEGSFQRIEGREAGVTALEDPRVRAAGFTGSFHVGRLLAQKAAMRPDPIPFYGELSSINPVFVTQAAATARADEIASGFVASMTSGAGQFCTKPGVLFVPERSALLAALEAQVTAAPPASLLHEGIAKQFASNREGVRAAVATTVPQTPQDGMEPTPTLLVTTIDELDSSADALLVECFGPSALVVEYRDEAQLLDAVRHFRGELTMGIQGEPSDAIARRLLPELAKRAGRVLWNQWPTGVTVSWAQQHGGPFPATTAPATTSMGPSAIDRFQRPVAYQGVPDELLPPEIAEANEWGVPRRVDGVPVP